MENVNIILIININITIMVILQLLKYYKHKKSVPASTPLKKDSLTVELAKTTEGFRFCLIKKKSN